MTASGARRVRADVGSVLRSNPGVIAYALRVGDELPEGGDHVHLPTR